MINKRTVSSPVAAHFHTRLPRRNSENQNPKEVRSLRKMRLQVASCHWLLLLLINFITRGLTADQRKHDFRRTSSGQNSLMDSMMKKYSYPKNEVTAGVGYGHHLHPLYYRGQKEMMYPCAVECGEWETMNMEDNSYDASSNVDVVTVRPDVSTIDITTPKPRPYKDVSSLRPKKYQSNVFLSGMTTTSTPKTTRQNDHFDYQDSKGADVQIIPQKSGMQGSYLGQSEDKESLNDGSLYARYHDTLVSGYDGELNTENSENKGSEYFDPVEESMRYNSPSFNDADNDDIEAPVYPTKINSHPKRERIEEKYVKHNLREEHLEDVRTNSFGTSGTNDEYPTDSATGKQADGYSPPKYTDDYAAPVRSRRPYPSNKNYQHKGARPFRPSPQESEALEEGERHPQGPHDPRNEISHEESNGYSDYPVQDYSVEDEVDYDEPPPKHGAYLGPTKPYNSPLQGSYIEPGRNHWKKHPYGRGIPVPRRRPLYYGRNRKYPPNLGVGHPHRHFYSQSETLRYPEQFSLRNPHSKNGGGQAYYPYAPRHGYSSQNQYFQPGGIRVISPPRIRGHPPRHGKYPYFKRKVPASPYVRGQLISYRRTVPQKDGFTKIVKKYRSFVDHTPQRYVGSGEP